MKQKVEKVRRVLFSCTDPHYVTEFSSANFKMVLYLNFGSGEKATMTQFECTQNLRAIYETFERNRVMFLKNI